MKLIELYKLVIKKGIEKDPRTRSEISRELGAARRQFRMSRGADRRAFDRERMSNPYSDTRILYGSPDRRVKTVMVGIDVEGPEILMAVWLKEYKGVPVDLAMAHHPEGIAWSGLYEVMSLQVSSLKSAGIAANAAERLLKERQEEVRRALAPANHSRNVDMARIFDMPYMCVHTPADNHVNDYLQKLFGRKRPRRLSQVISMLKEIPEFADGMKKGRGPEILIGDQKKECGKVFVDMTGGTEGPKKVFARLSQAGVGTVVGMHFSEEHYKNAKEEEMNLVTAGHISSDTLGLNLVLDGIEKRERLNIIPCSGFVRVKR